MLLRHTADHRALTFTGVSAALLATPFVVALPSMLYPFWIAISAIFCFIVCVINHNHAHVPLFKDDRANSVFGLYLTLLRGHSSSGVVVPHNLNHHIEHGSGGDWIDTRLAGDGPGMFRVVRYVIRATVSMARHRVQTGAPALNQQGRRRVRHERILLIAFLAAMLWLSPANTVLFLVLPWFLGVFMLVAVNLPQHDGCDASSELSSSRNFTGRFGNWFLFNNGYHVAHHLQPALHWSLLPAAHSELVDRLDPGLTHKSLLRYCARQYVLNTGG
jgi:fatty acid desaturase